MKETISYIKSKMGSLMPEIGIILGSGLGCFADEVQGIKIPYQDIPNFEKSKVEGHKGQLVIAEYNNKNIIIMQGRYHFYEGYSMWQITYPIKVMKKLGVNTLIITNAAGAINKNYNPSDLVFISDHINFMGTNPLIGENDNELGTRFPDMSEVYSKKLIEKSEKIAKKIGIKMHKGIYVATTGASYETPAEINMFRILGADMVGMSTVPEAIVAKWCGMDVLGISCITNYATGIINKPLSHLEVIDTADKAKNNFKTLLKEILLAKSD